MSQPIVNNMTGSSGTLTPSAPQADPSLPPVEQAPKLKGHRRLLQSLQRISSSPSLARVGRAPSSSYRSGGKGSMSCVSLSSSPVPHGHHYGQSYSSHSSQSSRGFSTAPTSVTSTPGLESELFDPAVRIRVVGGGAQSHVGMGPMTIALPADLRSGVREVKGECRAEIVDESDEYFLKQKVLGSPRRRRENFDFWGELPQELRVRIFQFLQPKQIIRCSAVSKSWQNMCFDGQLWINVDAQEYYQDIPSESLVKIMTAAGPFVRALNLRGCVQMPERWAATGRRYRMHAGTWSMFPSKGAKSIAVRSIGSCFGTLGWCISMCRIYPH
jgi:F-box and leucine-rich repeat protein 2/20